MPGPHVRLHELAAAVSDGAVVDWGREQSSASSDNDRELLDCLHLVERIAEVHCRGDSDVDGASVSHTAGSLTGDLGAHSGDDPIRWGPLAVIERIGSGSFGTVYRAWDPRLDREVALKLIRQRPAPSSSAAALEPTVIEEGRLMARLRHPGVVMVHGAERIDGRAGFWMELVRGQTLEQELATRGPMSADVVASIGEELCSALAAVHAAGLVHRDVKAQNVMRQTDGRVVLMDFGVGLELDEQGDAVAVAGTPLYLAPELLDGGPATVRADLYSLGVLLFHLASGRFPVEGPSFAAIVNAHAAGTRTSLVDLRPDFSRRVLSVIERASNPDPLVRFSSAEEMEQALRATRAPADGPRRWRRPLVGATAVLAIGVLLGGFGAPRSVSRSTEAIPFAARDWVLVAAFENRTGVAVFDDVVEHELERELVGSGFVNVVPRPRTEDVLSLMRKPPDQRLDAALAREVALRDGNIRALLTGGVRRTANVYTLTTNIVSPVDGSVIATISDDVSSPADVVGRIRAQAVRVRESLGEALSSLERSRAALQRVTTPSIEALQLYSKAAALLEGEVWRAWPGAISRYGSAEALLRKATEADPSFASAWLLLARVLSMQERPRNDFVPLAERALALSGTVGPAERYLIEGGTHYLRNDGTRSDRSELEAAARAYEALLQLAPDHYWGLIDLVTIHRALGRTADADRITLHAATVRPHSFRFAVDSAKVHVRGGDLAAADTIVSRLLESNPQPDDQAADTHVSLGWARLWKAHAAWLRNDVSGTLEAVRAAERQWSGNQNFVWFSQLASVYAGLGRFEDQLRLINRIEPLERRKWFLALNAANRERWDDLRRLLRPEKRNFDTLNRHLGMLTFAGWLADADWVLNERRRRGIRQRWDVRADFEGQLRAAQGRYDEAIALMQPLQTIDGVRFYVDDALAVARRGAGDLPGAIRELERVGASRSHAVTVDGWQVTSWLRCRVRLAEFYREAGHHAEAARVFTETRSLLSVADADHPLWARLTGPSERADGERVPGTSMSFLQRQ